MLFTRTVARRAHNFIASDSFFFIALGLFIAGACFIATTSLYPMAFDEEFHFGLIKIYAEAWSPYGIEHTPDMAQFGAATADASYLFHYLMSFPYRVFAAIGLSEATTIIILRLLNVAMAAGALVLFRRAIIETDISRSVANVALALFTLLPVLVMLAAHINYDNLLLLVTAWCVLLIVRITTSVKNKAPLPLVDVWQLAAAVLIGMSIKYAFLPLALGMFIWVVGVLILSYRSHGRTIRIHSAHFVRQWNDTSIRTRYILSGLALLSIFFASHYLTNFVSYGSPIPSCERVFTEQECEAYGPWYRNRLLMANKSESFQPLSYPEYMAEEWLPGMTQRLTFAVAGKTNDFQTQLPLPMVKYGFVVLSSIGLVCLLLQLMRRRIPWLTLFTILVTVVYAGVLSLQLYGGYMKTGEPVAINGRYLLLILPLVSVALTQAIRQTFHRGRPEVLALTATVVMLYFLVSGAGVGTYILQSEAHWYWPGFGQTTYEILHRFFEAVTIPLRS